MYPTHPPHHKQQQHKIHDDIQQHKYMFIITTPVHYVFFMNFNNNVKIRTDKYVCTRISTAASQHHIAAAKQQASKHTPK